MRVIILAIAVLLASGCTLIAQEPAAGPAGHLAAEEMVSGDFVQEKTIAGLRKPLRSTGDFLVVRSKGVIWRMLTPFASAVAVTAHGLWALHADGGTITREALHEGNMAMAMATIQQVLSGDPAALGKAFTVVESGDAAAWTMDLTPLDSTIARFIRTIHVRGGAHVDHVEYVEANGDSTRIDFSRVTGTAGALGAWAAAAFHE